MQAIYLFVYKIFVPLYVEYIRFSYIFDVMSIVTLRSLRFEFLNSKLEFVDSKLEFVDSKLEIVDSKLEFVDSKLEFVDSKLEIVDSKLEFLTRNSILDA
jgi:hypothetical protein